MDYDFLNLVIRILLYTATFGLPLFLTASNLFNLFSKKKFIKDAVDILIFTLGPLLMLLLYWLWSPENWQEAARVNDALSISFHEPISNHTTILLLAGIAFVGYVLLRIVKTTKLPPMVIVLCIAAQYIGCVLSFLWILQLTPNLNEVYTTLPGEGYLMCLFPLNYIISSVSLIRGITEKTSDILENQGNKNQLLVWCAKATRKSFAFPVAAFIFVWPLLGLILIVLILFGQKPDSAIKAFTDTSDWLFSKKTSPPSIVMEDDYICTVAASGHNSIVKPIRMGMRLGRPIVVNRQLCVTNAFEELLQEKTPRFHKLVRRIYDVVGYAIAKRIRTPFGADIAYIVIKPLEWFILIVLYSVERRPEERIARQYLQAETSKLINNSVE